MHLQNVESSMNFRLIFVTVAYYSNRISALADVKNLHFTVVKCKNLKNTTAMKQNEDSFNPKIKKKKA